MADRLLNYKPRVAEFNVPKATISLTGTVMLRPDDEARSSQKTDFTLDQRTKLGMCNGCNVGNLLPNARRCTRMGFHAGYGRGDALLSNGQPAEIGVSATIYLHGTKGLEPGAWPPQLPCAQAKEVIGDVWSRSWSF